MKATIGRIIIVKGGRACSNGADRAPAVITRVWGQDNDTRNGMVHVNATALCDLATPQVLGTIPLYDTEDEATDATSYDEVAFWPERAS